MISTIRLSLLVLCAVRVFSQQIYNNHNGIVGIHNGKNGVVNGFHGNVNNNVGYHRDVSSVNGGYQGNSFHTGSFRGNKGINNVRSGYQDTADNKLNNGINGNGVLGIQNQNGISGNGNGNGVNDNFLTGRNSFHGNTGIVGNNFHGSNSIADNFKENTGFHGNKDIVKNRHGINGDVSNFHGNNDVVRGQGQGLFNHRVALHGGIIEGTTNGRFNRNGFAGKGNGFVGRNSIVENNGHIGSQINNGISRGFVGGLGLMTGISNNVHNGINAGINGGIHSNIGGHFNNGLRGGNFVNGAHGTIVGSVNDRIHNGLSGNNLKNINGPVHFGSLGNDGASSQTFFNNGQGSFGKLNIGHENQINFDGQNNFGSPAFGNNNKGTTYNKGFGIFSNDEFGSDFGNKHGNNGFVSSDTHANNHAILNNNGDSVTNGIHGINVGSGIVSNAHVLGSNNLNGNHRFVAGKEVNNMFNQQTFRPVAQDLHQSHFLPHQNLVSRIHGNQGISNSRGVVGDGLHRTGNLVNFVGNGVRNGLPIHGTSGRVGSIHGRQVLNVNNNVYNGQVVGNNGNGIYNGIYNGKNGFNGGDGDHIGAFTGDVINNVGRKSFIQQAVGISGMKASDVIGTAHIGTMQKIQQL